METTAQPEPKHVAVINLAPSAREKARDVVRLLNWQSAEFRSIGDLMSALSLGAQVDTLLVAPGKNESDSFDAVKVAWEAVGLRTPLLLMVQDEQLETAAAFICGGHADFILASCEEQELASRLLVLEHMRAPLTAELDFLGGRYRFRTSSHSVEVDGAPVELTPREFDLTLHLFRHEGEIQSRESLYVTFWGNTEQPLRLRTLDAHVAKIRRKLRLHLPGHGFELRGIYGKGYLLSFLSPSQRTK